MEVALVAPIFFTNTFLRTETVKTWMLLGLILVHHKSIITICQSQILIYGVQELIDFLSQQCLYVGNASVRRS